MSDKPFEIRFESEANGLDRLREQYRPTYLSNPVYDFFQKKPNVIESERVYLHGIFKLHNAPFNTMTDALCIRHIYYKIEGFLGGIHVCKTLHLANPLILLPGISAAIVGTENAVLSYKKHAMHRHEKIKGYRLYERIVCLYCDGHAFAQKIIGLKPSNDLKLVEYSTKANLLHALSLEKNDLNEGVNVAFLSEIVRASRNKIKIIFFFKKKKI